MQKSYTEKDVARIIADVEKALDAHLIKSTETTLAKSEDGEKDHKEEHKEEPKHEEHSHEAKEHHEDEKDHEEKPEHEEHHEGHDYDEEDMAHMEKMYRSMSKGEMAAHHGCIMKCMGKSEAKSGEMSKAEISRCEPGKSPGAKSEASNANGEKINKSDGCGGEMSAANPKDLPARSPASKEQDDISKAETGKIEACEPHNSPGAKSKASDANGDKMNKSENTEVELLKSENEDLKKNFEAAKEFIAKLAKKIAPQGKAITSLDVIAKSEVPTEEKALSKKEIHEILKSKTAEPSLKKSDRDAINTFYLSGQVNVNSISHLLK